MRKDATQSSSTDNDLKPNVGLRDMLYYKCVTDEAGIAAAAGVDCR